MCDISDAEHILFLERRIREQMDKYDWLKERYALLFESWADLLHLHGEERARQKRVMGL